MSIRKLVIDTHCMIPFGLSPYRQESSYNRFMRRQSSNQVEALLIDRAAAAELPAAEGIQEWAREKRAFISSVIRVRPLSRNLSANINHRVSAV